MGRIYKMLVHHIPGQTKSPDGFHRLGFRCFMYPVYFRSLFLNR